MTDREKAIVMAFTGTTMLTGDKIQIFYDYVTELVGRPVWTHEMPALAEMIKEKSKADFLKLCRETTEQIKHGKWLPLCRTKTKTHPYYGTVYICSRCAHEITVTDGYRVPNYCEECGSKNER